MDYPKIQPDFPQGNKEPRYVVSLGMNLWHAVSKEDIKPEEFLACIEISADSSTKYELDKKTGALRLDRILSTATHYPYNYGFIPRTLGGDGDPLDVLLVTSRAIHPLALAKAIPLGVILMEDQGKDDEKIIAVCPDDPVYGSYRSMKELPPHCSDEIAHFFRVYKNLEPGMVTEVGPLCGQDRAKEVIADGMRRYNEAFPEK